MKKIIEIFVFPIKLLLLGLIYFYKLFISPLLPNTCIYQPSCSTYAVEAIKKHGIIYGAILAGKRILRCTPHLKGGMDVVPLNIKGADKWLL